MALSITLLISAILTLCWAAEDKSHDVWLIRIDEPVHNENWVYASYRTNKVDRNRKSLDGNITLLKELNEDNIMCQIKAFQKNGGKYVKAPFDIPKIPCCTLMKNNGLIWRCVQNKSNLPELCPIRPGSYCLKGFDPDLCEYPKNLPPNGAEDYKIEFVGTSGAEQIFKIVGYGKVKKRMRLDKL